MVWYNASWDYRRKIVVTNNIASALTDFQVLFTLDTAALVTAGKMQADGDDIIFADLAGVAQDYWIESGMNTNATKIWVEVKTIGASATKDIYLYYGNAGASTASNGDNTFIEYIDKDSTAGWTTYGGLTVTTSGDYLRFYNPVYANAGYAQKPITITPTTYIMETYFKTISIDTYDHCGIGLMDGSTLMSWAVSPKVSTNTWQYYKAGIGWTSIGAYTEGTEYIRKLIVDETDSTTGLDYILQNTGRTTINSALDARFSVITATDADTLRFGDSTGAGKCDIYVKWNLFRKYAATEPTHSAWGNEETDSGPAVSVDVQYLPILTATIDTVITNARTGANNKYFNVPIVNDMQIMFIHISQ